MDVKFVKAWVLFLLVSFLGSLGATMALGFVLGLILGASGISVEQMTAVSYALGLVVGLTVPFFSYRWSVKNYIFTQLPQAVPQEMAYEQDYPEVQPPVESDQDYQAEFPDDGDVRWRPPGN